jgi:NADH:ubiquinone oxidoreductase subunit 6 (subunit J)
MILTVLQHVPVWVFGLLLALIALGVSQSFARSATLRRVTVMPLVLLGWSLSGVISSFGASPLGGLALLAWAAGVGAAVLSLRGRLDVSAVEFSPATQHFQLPGSWLPLVLVLTLFALKFGAGMSLAMSPELRQSLPFVVTASLSFGAFSGVFLARALALWSLARAAQVGRPGVVA